MRKPGKTQGLVDYTRPIPLDHNDEYGNIQLLVAVYQQQENSSESFVYTPQNSTEFLVWNVLMGVKLTYLTDNDTYEFDVSDRQNCYI